MEKESLDSFILDFMLNASHLALVENAEGTSALIQSFYSFYRYNCSKRPLGLLDAELDMLQNYIRLKRISNEKIMLKISGDVPADVEINRMSLISKIDEMLIKGLSAEKASPEIKISFRQEPAPAALISLTGSDADFNEEVKLV